MQTEHDRLLEQLQQVLQALVTAQKLSILQPDALSSYAQLFVTLLHELTDTFIVKRKCEIRQKPEIGADSLFTGLPSDNSTFSEASALVQHFCTLLR